MLYHWYLYQNTMFYTSAICNENRSIYVTPNKGLKCKEGRGLRTTSDRFWYSLFITYFCKDTQKAQTQATSISHTMKSSLPVSGSPSKKNRAVPDLYSLLHFNTSESLSYPNLLFSLWKLIYLFQLSEPRFPLKFKWSSVQMHHLSPRNLRQESSESEDDTWETRFLLCPPDFMGLYMIKSHIC